MKIAGIVLPEYTGWIDERLVFGIIEKIVRKKKIFLSIDIWQTCFELFFWLF